MNPRPALRPRIGWPLLPLPNAEGQLEFPTLPTSVGENIRVMLQTRPGEQLMRPAYGAGLDAFLERSNTVGTRREIRDLVTEALHSWEPRIMLDRVEVLEVPDEPTHVRVEIAYRLQRTGLAQQMGLTMELRA